MTTIIFILELVALAALIICGALLLLDAGSKTDAEEAVPIEIKRNGAVVLSFRIRPMGEDEYLWPIVPSREVWPVQP